ncbi:MAG: aminotransferase class I/II-fold pyridoxal phosphate-dependent enzyme, partial [ANME-2 cluster archaeon]|nr:aminotransferase class I/II-fold pyridoxal phosphate-dependent enzyme [ANME-2 cluster archaeon]
FPKELDWLLESMAAVASETYTSVSAPIQFAAVHAFRGDAAIEHYLLHVRRILSTLGLKCHSILTEAGVKVHPPEGGFYLFLDFTPVYGQLYERGITDSVTLCERLLNETGVALLPGAVFEYPCHKLTARLSYVDFDGARSLCASETIPLHRELPGDFTEQICAKTFEGVRKIADWIGGKSEQDTRQKLVIIN